MLSLNISARRSFLDVGGLRNAALVVATVIKN